MWTIATQACFNFVGFLIEYFVTLFPVVVFDILILTGLNRWGNWIAAKSSSLKVILKISILDVLNCNYLCVYTVYTLHVLSIMYVLH